MPHIVPKAAGLLLLAALSLLTGCADDKLFAPAPGEDKLPAPKLIPMGQILAEADIPRRSNSVPDELAPRSGALQGRAEGMRAQPTEMPDLQSRGDDLETRAAELRQRKVQSKAAPAPEAEAEVETPDAADEAARRLRSRADELRAK